MEFSWSAFRPEASLMARMPEFARLPIEYLLTVYSGVKLEPVVTHVTRETNARVGHLLGSTAYSVALSARWTRFGGPWMVGDGGGEACAGSLQPATGLQAAFITAPSASRIVAEVSLRHPGLNHGEPPSAVAHFPVDGPPTAACMDVSPYFGSVQPLHLGQSFNRKPTLPSPRGPANLASPRGPSPQRSLGAADAGRTLHTHGEAGLPEREQPDAPPPLNLRPQLPTLVPMPPPKFTTRDPLTFKQLEESLPRGAPRPPSLPRRQPYSAR